VLIILPFAFIILGYIVISEKRHQENPADKVTPTIAQLADGFWRAATEPDRDGKIRLWVDTVASLRRMAVGVLLAAMVGILAGLHIGVMPFFEANWLKFVTFFDKIPALALLPILFIIFGLEETAKVALIFIGIVPTITLDTYLRAKEIPQEQIVKAFTLGASDVEVAYKVVLPQIFPKALDSVRLNLKGAWLFLIAAESIAATEGLGYRIFVVRRYLAMDIIIPYVLWIALLAFLVDLALRLWVTKGFRWLSA
jgi:NitT/TauT family transport system permease protein